MAIEITRPTFTANEIGYLIEAINIQIDDADYAYHFAVNAVREADRSGVPNSFAAEDVIYYKHRLEMYKTIKRKLESY